MPIDQRQVGRDSIKRRRRFDLPCRECGALLANCYNTRQFCTQAHQKRHYRRRAKVTGRQNAPAPLGAARGSANLQHEKWRSAS